MNATLQQRDEELLRQAGAPATTPFDYIVVGSGAGGGPLAARLAEGGRRVLVIEAGSDPAVGPQPGKDREVYAVPGYHAAATEDPAMTWDFSVRHYADDAQQRKDSKYDPSHDPGPGGAKGGILYPRCSAIGGCTAHHAMIMIRPNDADWDRVAQLTADDSWRSANMQGYFPKIERCLYYSAYSSFFGKWILGGFVQSLQGFATLLNPKRQLDTGHGEHGWQPTSFIDPLLITTIARSDGSFLRVLWGALLTVLGKMGGRGLFKRALTRFLLLQYLDPNVRSPDFPDRTHPSLIPIGTDGVRRAGVRERLLDVRKRFPDGLVILERAHATRVLFEPPGTPGDPPRAVGVEVAIGEHLYRASPMPPGTANPVTAQYFAKSEVILCGGTFNTPQLLMLSGIGDAAELRGHGIAGPRDARGTALGAVVDLPGVGKNLQDRYEVSVVSEAKDDFSTLKGVTFVPDDPQDPARKKWEDGGMGLYSTNGGALALMSGSSQAQPHKPDLFIFGIPAAFRGYYWSWSKELLRKTKGASEEQRNLWSWVILKAYTKNNKGTVRLRSADPFAPPEINFHSFAEGPADYGDDVVALRDAVGQVRAINQGIKALKSEVQPGAQVTGDAELADWVQREAWGHHACGTCRIGADGWRADVKALQDRDAVLDSKFRVHGVSGLRVVDASVFPWIPGYFIVTPVFMIGEKAADTIFADSPKYPSALEQAEAAAVRTRRAAAGKPSAADTPSTSLPPQAIGLALSGGGIRSAAYALGVVQSLAARGKLRDIDFLSAVSGGGYVGAFLGRLFTRVGTEAGDKVSRVEKILATPSSPELWWLRGNADYIAGAGRADLLPNLSVVARNLFSVHVCLGALFLGLLGALRWLQQWFQQWLPPAFFPADMWVGTLWGIALSPWWVLPFALLFFAALPMVMAFWLSPPADPRRPYMPIPLLLWAALAASGVAALGFHDAAGWGVLLSVALLIAWLIQDAARWNIELPADAAPGMFAVRVRNRLNRALGATLLALVALIAAVLLDSLARRVAAEHMPAAAWAMMATAVAVPLLRGLAVLVMGSAQAGKPDEADRIASTLRLLGKVAFAVAALLVFYLDVLAHAAFNTSLRFGIWMVASTLLVSVILGRAFRFLNLSSLQPFYTEKLVRTFLGASNDARVHPTGTDAPVRVDIPDERDDVGFAGYHPEASGGPLHLVNTCVNETVDVLSGRQLRQDKGLPMCVGPGGVSVGLRYHALWEAAVEGEARKALRAIAVAPDPHLFHVFGRKDNEPAKAESLRLGQWMAISGAAFTTGAGRHTSLPHALLFGLLNVRLGYWWNSGIDASDRPGRYPPQLWRRIKALPASIFRLQAMLLDEWRAYFPGPSARFWYLSDGGHFENTGLYELLRRRLPFIIAADAGQDEGYQLEDLAIVTRQVRLDFGADFAWMDPTVARAGGATGWDAIDQASDEPTVPTWIRAHFEPGAIGPLSGLKRDAGQGAALARITYGDDKDAVSWLVFLKPCLQAGLPTDIAHYAATHTAFPQEPTADQFFSDDQWESYRLLGQYSGLRLFK